LFIIIIILFFLNIAFLSVSKDEKSELEKERKAKKEALKEKEEEKRAKEEALVEKEKKDAEILELKKLLAAKGVCYCKR
jgi:hypothetical protein